MNYKPYYIIIILIPIFLGFCWWAYSSLKWIPEEVSNIRKEQIYKVIDPVWEDKQFSIQEKIQIYAKEIDNYDTYIGVIADKIAWCETRFRNIPNSQGTRYGIGVFQFVQSTWDEQCEGDVWNEYDNIRCALQLIKKGQLWRWNMSKHCWDK
ncbi:MAG: hypothetical protein HQ538_01365 [Parcubacteria group bacterium]|nr:hypothetical protein [Parcubacteria group bacterium]